MDGLCALCHPWAIDGVTEWDVDCEHPKVGTANLIWPEKWTVFCSWSIGHRGEGVDAHTAVLSKFIAGL